MSERLRRELGVPGAVLLGLGSILGAGVFVSIGLGAALAGSAVLIAIAIAAGVASCNALSSAQLAAAHPVSGGTYEYGYRYLSPRLGFTAGWLFLLAKSASAATAALGFAGYLGIAVGLDPDLQRFVGAGTALLVTAVVAGGVRRSNVANLVIVGATILGLSVFVVTGFRGAVAGAPQAFARLLPASASPEGLLHASALMFVAYTGYGRVATMGEEIRDPARNIPRAIITTLIVSALLYLLVAFVALGLSGAEALARATADAGAPLETIARQHLGPGVGWIVGVAAMTAMLGVLLNLVLGLSRVLLAMGRRGDMPAVLARLDPSGSTPTRAVWVMGLFVTGLALIGDLALAWTFSAFTVLCYYALTNASALRLPAQDRRFPSVFAWGGLASCLVLAFFVPLAIWAAGLGVLMIGQLAFTLRHGSRRDRGQAAD